MITTKRPVGSFCLYCIFCIVWYSNKWTYMPFLACEPFSFTLGVNNEKQDDEDSHTISGVGVRPHGWRSRWIG